MQKRAVAPTPRATSASARSFSARSSSIRLKLSCGHFLIHSSSHHASEAVLVNSFWAVLPDRRKNRSSHPSPALLRPFPAVQGLELDVVLYLDLLLLRPRRAQESHGLLMENWGFAFRSRARLPDPGTDRRPLPGFLAARKISKRWTHI